jgi:bifunctional non-homologous end joining protein LigD
MLASTEQPPIAQPGLVYEPKYDGIRALVDLDASGTGVRVYSRNGNDKTNQFPGIAAALRKIAAKLDAPLLVDGEVVAINHAGVPLGFQQLQGRIGLTGVTDIQRQERHQPAAIILFDLLRDGDQDLRGLPMAQRRLALQRRLGKLLARRDAASVVRLSEIVTDDGTKMLERAKREGWEGLIVKNSESLYHSGKRTPAWRKLKLLRQQEFVIGGWTEPRQTRSHFGSLLVGYRKGADLIFSGNVGTGFTQSELDKLAKLFAKRARAGSPFTNNVTTNETPHWLTPDLVCEVKFVEWTNEGLLRQPVYLGLLDDKSASEVGKEPTSECVSMAAPMKKTSTAKAAKPKAVAGLGELIDQLTVMEMAKRDGEVTLPGGGTLRVTNLAKILWPKLKATKGELLRYYAQVSPLILPVVDDRPLVMKRSPNGVDKPFFYQQRHPEASPAGVRRDILPDDIDPIEDGNNGGQPRLVGGSLATLLYMSQLAALSQDPWFSRVTDPLHMDYAAIDLDPGDDAKFGDVVDVARWVHDELDRLHIPAVPKTSGSSGIHIYIPLPKKTSYETGQLLCNVVATIVSTKHPKVATIQRMVRNRARSQVYVDYLQNIIGKTLATAYSARASDYAGVSTPLAWNEVTRQLDPRDFTIRTAPARFAEVGDLWKPLRTLKPVDIANVLKKLQ